MKKFKTHEIRDLLNQVYHEEISFSRMVEILNERVNESEVSEFKDGDFVVNMAGDILIFREKEGNFIYDHAYLQKGGILWVEPNEKTTFSIECLATEAEKQELLDALAKEGKRWNAEKKCVEDIPVRKFKVGDKVRIKDGVSSKTHVYATPYFASEMDEFIGKELTVEGYRDGFVLLNEDYYKCFFAEDWLEPYTNELKEGDIAIFWNLDKWEALVGKYNGLLVNHSPYHHRDHRGNVWANAIKFESKEQYERFIKGEI